MNDSLHSDFAFSFWGKDLVVSLPVRAKYRRTH